MGAESDWLLLWWWLLLLLLSGAVSRNGIRAAMGEFAQFFSPQTDTPRPFYSFPSSFLPPPFYCPSIPPVPSWCVCVQGMTWITPPRECPKSRAGQDRARQAYCFISRSQGGVSHPVNTSTNSPLSASSPGRRTHATPVIRLPTVPVRLQACRCRGAQLVDHMECTRGRGKGGVWGRRGGTVIRRFFSWSWYSEYVGSRRTLRLGFSFLEKRGWVFPLQGWRRRAG